MIDLKKEKQLMINAMRESGVIEIKPNTHQFHDHLKTWCKRAKLARAEITEIKKEEIKYKEKHGQLIGKIHALEKKLDRYKDPEFVLVRRKPTKEMIRAGENNHSCPEIGSINEVADIYEAMIEAMEKK